MLEDPQKFLKSNFWNFLKKKSKVALLDLGKYQNEQSHEVSWVWVQNCRHGAQILGSMGHNGPCPCGIGLSYLVYGGQSLKTTKWLSKEHP